MSEFLWNLEIPFTTFNNTRSSGPAQKTYLAGKSQELIKNKNTCRLVIYYDLTQTLIEPRVSVSS